MVKCNNSVHYSTKTTPTSDQRECQNFINVDKIKFEPWRICAFREERWALCLSAFSAAYRATPLCHWYPKKGVQMLYQSLSYWCRLHANCPIQRRRPFPSVRRKNSRLHSPSQSEMIHYHFSMRNVRNIVLKVFRKNKLKTESVPKCTKFTAQGWRVWNLQNWNTALWLQQSKMIYFW